MVRIWRDRLDQLVPPDTGTLRRSIEAASFKVDGYSLEAAFRFVQYGIYVDAGVGNGYKHGNGGNLQILGEWNWLHRDGTHFRDSGVHPARWAGRADDGLLQGLPAPLRVVS